MTFRNNKRAYNSNIFLHPTSFRTTTLYKHAFRSTIFFTFLFLLGACSEEPRYEYVGELIKNEQVVEIKPYAGKKVLRLCIVNSGANLRNFVAYDYVVPYGHDAILEIYEEKYQLELIVEGKVRHRFVLNEGSAYCTVDPESLVLSKSEDYWIFFRRISKVTQDDLFEQRKQRIRIRASTIRPRLGP